MPSIPAGQMFVALEVMALFEVLFVIGETAVLAALDCRERHAI